MKFSEAMKLLEEGKKVRCIHPDADNYPFDRFMPSSRWAGLVSLHSIDWDWELYEEPEKLLSFQDVVKGLKEGKKFRRKAWNMGIYMTPDGQISRDASPWTAWYFTIRDFEATDWIEIK